MDDVTRLLEALPAGVRATAHLLDRGKSLDKHYLPAPYSNGSAGGTPRQHYTRREAEEAVADAEAVLEFCERSIHASPYALRNSCRGIPACVQIVRSVEPWRRG